MTRRERLTRRDSTSGLINHPSLDTLRNHERARLMLGTAAESRKVSELLKRARIRTSARAARGRPPMKVLSHAFKIAGLTPKDVEEIITHA